MRLKQVNVDKELKKVQGQGIYDKRVRTLLVIGVVCLVVAIGSSFAIFSSDGTLSAFTSTISKKVNVTINVTNGIIDTKTKNGKYNEELNFTATPNNGYKFGNLSCTNSQNATYDSLTKTLSITPTNNTTCTINFKVLTTGDRIIANNVLKNEQPNFLNAEPPLEGTNSGSGVYKAEDDDGESYYFRGEIENNYVQFGTYKTDYFKSTVAKGTAKEQTSYSDEYSIYSCNNFFNLYKNIYSNSQECVENIYREVIHPAGSPILWKIVRINGDGTIRLITVDNQANLDFNEMDFSQGGLDGKVKYNSYMYDNDHICTKDNPCYSDSGTNSLVKTYLENWYTTNLADVDNRIAITNYCNDTTYTSANSVATYSPFKRINAGNPSLKCPASTASYMTFGGFMKLKIGLLSADEMNMAGLALNKEVDSTNYLGLDDWWSTMTMSPHETIAGGEWGIFVGDVLIGSDSVEGNGHIVRPVINLKADVTITSGDGTKNNPYIIE